MSISRWFLVVGMVALSWKSTAPLLWPLRPQVLAAPPLIRMVRLGLPIGIQHELEFGAFGATALLMGLLGTLEMASHQVAITLASFTFMMPLGVGAAAAVLVGQSIGRGDPDAARTGAQAALATGAGIMLLAALVMFAFPGFLAQLFTDERDVIALAAMLIPVAGVFQVFDGTQVVAAGVLRGAGDTRAPMIASLVGFWLIGFPISIYFGFWTDAGPIGLWWGLVAGLAAVAVFLLWRVRARFRRSLERVLIDDEPA